MNRLIEVALPIREISAESVRDKNIHHAHISHLHIWWARRPLAASRAVVFASLVPDPDHDDCPPEFRAAVNHLLKDHVPSILKRLKPTKRNAEWINDPDPYCPYDGIEDTPRNRLLTFIARWSNEWIAFEKGMRDKQPPPAEMLDDRCLVKWETSNPESKQGREVLRVARELVCLAHGGNVPTLLDPFAGGGAIPLEASRLGCQAIANDYNPVACLILRATCEFPQKYGKPGKRKAIVQDFGKKSQTEIEVPNVLAHDVEYWARWILERAKERIGHLYPSGKDGRPILAYLWARTVPCSNPSCRGEIPLLRSLLLRSSAESKVALALDVDKKKKTIQFGITRDKSVKNTEGTKRQRGPAICPYCEQPTSEKDLRWIAVNGHMRERMVAVVVEGRGEKDYRIVEKTDLDAFRSAQAFEVDVPAEYIVPEINAPNASPDAGSHRSINLELYGFTRWGQLFNHRQLVVMHQLIEGLHRTLPMMEREISDPDYRQAIVIILGLWIDRVAAFGNTMTRWRSSHEKSETPFSGQSIPMMWDYPEVNPFADSSGTASTQLDYMLKVILHECTNNTIFSSPRITLGSAVALPVEDSSCDCVVTDPPYGNSIAYADLSDFFYVWLKRSIGDVLPAVFTTPQTPKEQEATSHKHRHQGSQDRANTYYQRLLTESFKESLRVVKNPKLVSVMFAHQSTEAWSALINALLDSGLTATATYPIETEMKSTALALGTASLETSITVICRPRQVGSAASFRDVRREIERVVAESVHRFWSYGFRGADLIVACYGPAVGVFGRYERVERGDGTPVGVPELLELAREAALKAIAGEFQGDNLSRLYFVWCSQYGASSQPFDDLVKVAQMSIEAENAIELAHRRGLFVVDGATCRLALLRDRVGRPHMGDEQTAPLIDQLHHAMRLWQEEKRADLVTYLAEHSLIEHAPLWKLAQALFEVLPREEADWKLISALLGERETLRMQARPLMVREPAPTLFSNDR